MCFVIYVLSLHEYFIWFYTLYAELLQEFDLFLCLFVFFGCTVSLIDHDPSLDLVFIQADIRILHQGRLQDDNSYQLLLTHLLLRVEMT